MDFDLHLDPLPGNLISRSTILDLRRGHHINRPKVLIRIRIVDGLQLLLGLRGKALEEGDKVLFAIGADDGHNGGFAAMIEGSELINAVPEIALAVIV